MSATIVFDRPVVLADEPVAFQVSGCTAGEPVTISATWRIGGDAVRTEARFVAPADGIIAPASQDSIGGTYVGTEPYGLWWSVDRQEIPTDTDLLAPWIVWITASGSGWETSRSLTRVKIDPSVRQVRVDTGRLRGVAFRPPGEGPFPSVVSYSGSGGGLETVVPGAALLASRGFAVLALGYFRYEDLPDDLVEIPLEYFREAIDWLKVNAPALGGRVAVMGASRGGELSLLLGSTYPDAIAAVVAKVPSGVIWGGFGRQVQPGAVAWTFKGRPVKPLETERPDRENLPLRDGAIALTPGFEESLATASPDQLAAAEIGVERLGGPALLLSAEDDAMWPSVAMSEIAVRRAGAHAAQYPVRHLRYPDAGHSFTVPAGFLVARSAVHPVSGQNYAYGGSLVGNAHASTESWAETLDFLAAALRTRGLVNA